MDAQVEAVARELAGFEWQESELAIVRQHTKQWWQDHVWHQHEVRAQLILAAADAHPSPAQQQARELLAKVNELAEVVGPVSFCGDEIRDTNDNTVLELAYSIDAPKVTDFINRACGWEAAE